LQFEILPKGLKFQPLIIKYSRIERSMESR
jgi:hypothetical protein